MERSPRYKMKSLVLGWAASSWDATLKEINKTIIEHIYNIWSGLIGWTNTLMNRYGVDNVNYFIGLEVQSDMEASTLLAFSGFYRHGNFVLRSCLELTLLGLWFGPKQTALYLKWKANAPDAPFKGRGYVTRKWLDDLLQRPPFVTYNKKFSLAHDTWCLYDKLSQAVHAKGERILETKTRGDSVTGFRKEHFMAWYSNLTEAFQIISICLFLLYPNLFLKPTNEVQEIISTLGEATSARLGSCIG